jgi:hypothetical protein
VVTGGLGMLSAAVVGLLLWRHSRSQHCPEPRTHPTK